jgi:hypothetical protein
MIAKKLIYVISGLALAAGTSLVVVSSLVGAGVIDLDKTPIGITTPSGKQIYDGKSYTSKDFTLTSGELYSGDYLQGSSFPFQDAGVYKNEVRVEVYNANHVNHSSAYSIAYDYGRITVDPRPLTVTLLRLSKSYRGAAMDPSDYQISYGSLCENHTMEVRCFDSNPEMVQANVHIYDAAKIEVTPNYAITLDYGTINERWPLTVETFSASKNYDGTPLKAENYTLKGDLRPDHRAEATDYASITDPGSISNTMVFRVYDSANQNVTASLYSIQYIYGTLTVNPPKATSSSPSGSQGGGGGMSGGGNDSMSGGGGGGMSGGGSGSMSGGGSSMGAGGGGSESSSSGNESSSSGSESSSSGSESSSSGSSSLSGGQGIGPTSAGLTDNGDVSNSGLSNGEAQNETPLVKITTNYGQFAHLRMMSKGDYDPKGSWGLAPNIPMSGGNPFFITTDKIMGGGVATSHIKIEVLAPIDYQLLDYYTYGSEAGNDVTYGSSGIAGTIWEENFYPFDFMSEDASKLASAYSNAWNDSHASLYEAAVKQNYLKVPESDATYMQAIIAKQGWSDTSLATIRAVCSYISSAATYNLNFAAYPSGVDPVIYFLDTAKEGICNNFASAAVLLYRTLGIPARYTIGLAGGTDNAKEVTLTAKNAHAWVEVYLGGVGWIVMDPTPGSSDNTIGGSGGSGLSGQGNNGKDGGNNTTSGVLDPFGDSTSFPFPGAGGGNEGTLGGGSGSSSGSGGGSGSGSGSGGSGVVSTDGTGEKIYYDGVDEAISGEDDADPYALSIVSRSFTKTYDGLPLCNNATPYTITLKTGDVLSVSFPATITDVGSVSNRMVISINSPEGYDTKSLYTITKTYGSLSITPREITVTTESAEKTYDGTALTKDAFSISKGTLVAGENLTLSVTGSQTEVGVSDNTCENALISDAAGNDVSFDYNVTYILGTLTVKGSA